MSRKNVAHLHVTMSKADYQLLGFEAVRRGTGRGLTLLTLAGPALARLRKADRDREASTDEQRA